jgi:hypothetical protein
LLGRHVIEELAIPAVVADNALEKLSYRHRRSLRALETSRVAHGRRHVAEARRAPRKPHAMAVGVGAL